MDTFGILHLKTHGDDCVACKVEAVQTRLVEAERDAARYRWLRGRNELTADIDPAGPFVIETDADDTIHYPTGKAIDAVIDMLIAADSAEHRESV